MSNYITIKTEVERRVINITIDREETVLDYKKSIFRLTNIPINKINFVNYTFPEIAPDTSIDDLKIGTLNFHHNFILIIKWLKHTPSSSNGISTSTNTGQAQFTNRLGIKNIGGIKEWKPLCVPRRKKLLVLDIDQTIYDLQAPNRHLVCRPYLHIFLENVYKYYSIGIWSNTPMISIEAKLNNAGLLNHKKFKLSFLMDKFAMVKFPCKNRTLKVKDLHAVWCKYPQFNESNTLICDDVIENFSANPENGILILPYNYTQYNEDIELLKLKNYLEAISESKDFSKVDHSKWNKLIEF